jgi:pyrophosphatase PpaX
LLAYNGLQNAFDIIVGRSDCAARKPHPQPLAIALEKLGIAHPKRALYVGDLQTDDVGAGNALGMKTALIGKGVLDRYGPLPTYHWPDLEKLRRMYGRR